MEAEPVDWKVVASELLRAARAGRSQVALSRRLGYRSNVACDWEAGRRFPATARALRDCEALGLPVRAAFRAFQPSCAEALFVGQGYAVGRFLDALRGRMSVAALAEQSGYSRHAVARWLSESAAPRLPAFLHLVDVISGRASDLVNALVPIEQVPSLLASHRRRVSAQRVAFDCPWTEAVLRVVETVDYRRQPRHEPGRIASQLGISLAQEQEALRRLTDAGVLQLDDGRYRDLQPLTVDTSASVDDFQKLRAHWTRVCLDRATAPMPDDWLGYNVMSLSSDDLERVRQVLRGAYREIRAIAAASEPAETVALLNLQLIGWPSTDEPDPVL